MSATINRLAQALEAYATPGGQPSALGQRERRLELERAARAVVEAAPAPSIDLAGYSLTGDADGDINVYCERCQKDIDSAYVAITFAALMQRVEMHESATHGQEATA